LISAIDVQGSGGTIDHCSDMYSQCL
jgi:hypothetical protein